MSELETVSSDDNPRVDLFFTPHEISEDRLKEYHVVVIDVLRAATSIAVAFSNGARDVFPAATISEAIDLSTDLKRADVLLCGEREGKLIEGFHLGNSPSDYSLDRVRGRTLIFGSTNGSPAVVKSMAARSVFLCAFVNLNAVIEALFAVGEFYPLALVCAGKQSRFAIEDAVCGGMLIQRVSERSGTDPALNDAARVAVELGGRYGGDLHGVLRESDHGRYLATIGMESDLTICAADSVLPIVPALSDGKLVKLERK